MIGPPHDFRCLDMIESVLEKECADRGISHLGQTARELEQSIFHAFALGIQDRFQLQVFIRNLVQNELDFAVVLGSASQSRIPRNVERISPRPRFLIV